MVTNRGYLSPISPASHSPNPCHQFSILRKLRPHVYSQSRVQGHSLCFSTDSGTPWRWGRDRDLVPKGSGGLLKEGAFYTFMHML